MPHGLKNFYEQAAARAALRADFPQVFERLPDLAEDNPIARILQQGRAMRSIRRIQKRRKNKDLRQLLERNPKLFKNPEEEIERYYVLQQLIRAAKEQYLGDQYAF